MQCDDCIYSTDDNVCVCEDVIFNIDECLSKIDIETYNRIYNKAIDDFSNKIIDIVNDFPTVENEDGEIRPMRIEEICNNISEQLKEGK